jgi:hypothetical protein
MTKKKENQYVKRTQPNYKYAFNAYVQRILDNSFQHMQAFLGEYL